MRTENLEIYPKDLPEKLSWKKAMEVCETLGDGWRLPTIDELNEVYTFYCEGFNYVTFKHPYYWSSSDKTLAGILPNYEDISNRFFAFGRHFNSNKDRLEIDKEHRHGVRPVRDL